MALRRTIRTSFKLESYHLEGLKEIAGALGFRQSRGPGAGRLPNISALLRALVDADRKQLIAALRQAGIGAGTE